MINRLHETYQDRGVQVIGIHVLRRPPIRENNIVFALEELRPNFPVFNCGWVGEIPAEYLPWLALFDHRGRRVFANNLPGLEKVLATTVAQAPDWLIGAPYSKIAELAGRIAARKDSIEPEIQELRAIVAGASSTETRRQEAEALLARLEAYSTSQFDKAERALPDVVAAARVHAEVVSLFDGDALCERSDSRLEALRGDPSFATAEKADQALEKARADFRQLPPAGTYTYNLEYREVIDEAHTARRAEMILAYCQALEAIIGTYDGTFAASKARKLLDEVHTPYLDAALDAGHWLRSTARSVGQGKAWSPRPDDSAAPTVDLYSGTAGVVLFFLELYAATREEVFLGEARAGADFLVASLPDALDNPAQAGLYTGVAGVGFVLERFHQVTGEATYRQAAQRCLNLVLSAAHTAGSGCQWSATTDIISGGAGIGLYLLNAAEQLRSREAESAAAAAGKRLIEIGIPEGGGMKWPVNDNGSHFMPNFSHGTAGVGFFLATLFEKTEQEAFRKAALSAGRYLLAVTNDDGLVFHHEQGGEDLYYLGWCHGPPGTARLYFKLWQLTGEDLWRDAMRKAAAGILRSGIPEKAQPGFWNNVGLCCGSAGIARFFLWLYQVTGEQDYIDFSRRLTADILARATCDSDSGLRWIHAEHRVRPGLMAAQPGYMQGAAGIGLWLLNLDAFERRRAVPLPMPDAPF